MAPPARHGLVSSALALDVRSMARAGLFDDDEGRTGSWSWQRGGERIASVSYTATPEALSLRFATVDPWTDERTSHAPRIPLAWTPCRYGGRRPWFLCPACSRRCAVLYIRGRAACRRCHGLSYPSTRETAGDRAQRRLTTLAHRLGLDHFIDLFEVDKPPHMRRETWARLQAEANELELRRLHYLGAHMPRRLRALA